MSVVRNQGGEGGEVSERTNRWKRRTYDSVDERQAVTESRKSSISVFKETPDTLTRLVPLGWDRILLEYVFRLA